MSASYNIAKRSEGELPLLAEPIIVTHSAVDGAHPNLPIPGDNVSIEELVNAFLAGKSVNTLTAYRRDLLDFASFLGVKTIDEVAKVMFEAGQGRANLIAVQFKDFMIKNNLSPATINRKLSSLRSLITAGQTFGLIHWDLVTPFQKSQAYRDTRGMGVSGVRCLLNAAHSQRSPMKRARDKAIIYLLFHNALRRSEVSTLDLLDYEAGQSRIMILGKGRSEKEPITLAEPTKQALDDWLAFRGEESGALFYNLDRAKKGDRLSSGGLYRMIRWLGQKAMIVARPHGIRHSSITHALDITNGNVRQVRSLSRHRSYAVLCKYDDSRIDFAGQLSKRLAEDVV